MTDANLRAFSRADVVTTYTGFTRLTACERMLFETYVTPGAAVLDLGVGAGRTTAWLAPVAGTYVGVDYSEAMLDACRARFPDATLLARDAADLSGLDDGAFDVVVFSFNGIDCLHPDDRRRACLAECARVLRPGGHFIFSVHNPYWVFTRPYWPREPVERAVSRVLSPSAPGFAAAVAALRPAYAAGVVLRGLPAAARRLRRKIATRAWWRGDGYAFDPVDGGLLLHHATPRAVVAETTRAGFRIVRVVGDDYPRASRALLTPWSYYVFVRAA